MKNKFIIATFLSAFLLVAPNVKAANFTNNQTVDANKTWTIKFTGEVGLDNGNIQGITVTDSKGSTVLVGIKLGQDNKTVIVTAPQAGYTVGESYILNIGNKAHSSKGKALKKEYRMNFNIRSNEGEGISFLDKKLEKAIREEINKPTGDIYKGDVEKITKLSHQEFDRFYRNGNIKDLSGIENLTNLKELYLLGNSISDISPLKGLSNLEVLDLNDNLVSDISALKGLSNLKELYLTSNLVSDISPLQGSKNLQVLWMPGNKVKDISIIGNLTNLQDLGLIDDNVSDANIQALKKRLINCKIRY